jgi:uncharacterized membrane protein
VKGFIMEGLIAFLILVGIVFLAMPIIAFGVASSARGRVVDLEARLGKLLETVQGLERRVNEMPRSAPWPAAPPAEEPVIELVVGPERVKPVKAAAPPAMTLAEALVAERAAAPPVVRAKSPSTPKPAPVPAPPVNWEKMFASALPWLGAVALAGTGVFAVKVMAEHGLLEPKARVALAALFGVVLIGGARWLRNGQAKIAEAMAAAGVTTLYAAVLAAFKLYALIGQVPAFGCIAAITALAVFLSLRHGPVVALLGLIGGFLMPALISRGEPPPMELFAYLLFLEIGLTVVTRGRKWWWLTLLTMIGGLGWAGLWIALFFEPAQAHWVGLFLLASIASFVVATIGAEAEDVSKIGVAGFISWAAVAAGLAMVAWLVNVSGFTNLEWAMLGVLSAGAMVLARLRHCYFPLAALAAAACAVMVGVWGGSAVEHGGFTDEVLARFPWVVLAMGVLFGAGGYAGLWGARRANAWASLSVGSVGAFTLIGWWFIGDKLAGHMPPWWAIAGILAGQYALAAIPVQQRRSQLRGGDDAMAALMVAVTAMTSWMVVLLGARHEQFGRQWVTIAWALEVAALAWTALGLKLPKLYNVLGVVAAGVAVRLLMNPAVLTYPLSEHVIFNWIPCGYGLPAALFMAAAWRVRRDGQKELAGWLEAGAAGFVFAMVSLLVRHGFHPTSFEGGLVTLNEASTYATAWMGLGLVAEAASKRWGGPLLNIAARVIVVLGLVAALVGPGLFVNPLWTHEWVGATPVANWLLYVYGIPVVIAAAASMNWKKSGHTAAATVAGLCGLALAFGLVSLEVRQAFQGVYLDGGSPDVGEMYAYSAAWILFAGALLTAGLALGSPMLRYASAGVMLVAVGKVFIVDTRHLQDLLRVASYFGLGVSLLLLAWVYQKFVFTRPKAAE